MKRAHAAGILSSAKTCTFSRLTAAINAALWSRSAALCIILPQWKNKKHWVKSSNADLSLKVTHFRRWIKQALIVCDKSQVSAFSTVTIAGLVWLNLVFICVFSLKRLHKKGKVQSNSIIRDAALLQMSLSLKQCFSLAASQLLQPESKIDAPQWAKMWP